MENITFVFVLLIIGVILRLLGEFRDLAPERRGWLFAVPGSLADGLTTVVIYVSLPALILYRIPGLTVSTDVLVPIVIPWVMLAFGAGMVHLFSQLFSWDRRTKALLLLIVPLGNTSFLGIPMVEAFFGDFGVQFALLYDQFGSFLALATYGTIIVSMYGGGEGGNRPQVGTVVRAIFAFPPFLALLVSLGIRGVPLPGAAIRALSMLSETLVPLVMIAVGFKIRFRLPAAHLLPFGVGLGVKMVAAPLLALAACRMLDLHGTAVDVAVFEAGMPPMIAAWALAMKADFEPELGAAMVGYGILFSFVTLFALSVLIHG